MHFESIEVQNYKGFADSGSVSLSPGFNLIVGQNNSGKTALLEAFRLSAQGSNPHKRKDKPAGYPLDPRSHFRATISVEGGELRNDILSSGIAVDVPFPGPWSDHNVNLFIGELFSQTHSFGIVGSMDGTQFASSGYPSHRRFPDDGREPIALRLSPNADRQDFSMQRINSRIDNLVDTAVLRIATSRTFVFRAERLNIGTSASADSIQLRPDAGNLPTALAWLAGQNPVLFGEYIEAVNTVLPSVKYVTSLAAGSNFALQIWTTSPSEKRPDLAVSLSDSGTGVGQVLAMLFVVMTMPPSVLVIDEPNSFLHPGAAKKLLDIFRGLPHQYIISTHSAEVIAAAGDPSTIHVVRWDGEASSVQRIDGDAAEAAKFILAELGSSLADVFSADEVIWVEGLTEELCFPLLLAHMRIHRPGLVIRGVKNTGDFEGKKARMAWEVYSRLSGAYALVPPALAFSFDKELRNPKEMQDLVQESGGKVHFLGRRTFENFLLHPSALSAALADMGYSKSPDDVAGWLHAARKSDPNQRDEQRWLEEVDAPRLLKQLFWESSGKTLEYRKSEHSVTLTRWLLANDAKALIPLLDYVSSLLA